MTENLLIGSKILLIGPYPPPFGGVATHMQNLHNRLLTTGIHAEVISSNPLAKTDRHIRHEPLNLYWFLTSHNKLKSYSLIHYHATAYNIKGLIALVLLVKSDKPLV